MIEINGRTYPLWSQFVERKKEWIGGVLEETSGDHMDKILGLAVGGSTEIIDIELRPNGKETAFFEIVGKEFSCGFSTEVGGIIAGEEGFITFSGYGGHTFRIKKRLMVIDPEEE